MPSNLAPLGRRLVAQLEAAGYIGIATRTLRSWVAAGRIPVVRVGRAVRFDLRDLDAFIDAAKVDQADVRVCSMPTPPSIRAVAGPRGARRAS